MLLCASHAIWCQPADWDTSLPPPSLVSGQSLTMSDIVWNCPVHMHTCHYQIGPKVCWYTTVALSCVKPIQQRPVALRDIKTWMSDDRIIHKSTADHRSWHPVITPSMTDVWNEDRQYHDAVANVCVALACQWPSCTEELEVQCFWVPVNKVCGWTEGYQIIDT